MRQMDEMTRKRRNTYKEMREGETNGKGNATESTGQTGQKTLSMIPSLETHALWFRGAMDRDESTGPPACPFAHLPTPLTLFLAPHSLLRSRAELVGK